MEEYTNLSASWIRKQILVTFEDWNFGDRRKVVTRDSIYWKNPFTTNLLNNYIRQPKLVFLQKAQGKMFVSVGFYLRSERMN